ncbi:TIGR03557 family F420-dependent LLM class oxidoreductase [Nonomuraea sp. NPDC005983]|uniref:TIGR03557 family F420-dependent LLM class oxidoreductase n=1 Tax=Nonomuraea sp. NPDC005983 TaxID=3155595 RepID=UPI0033BB282F
MAEFGYTLMCEQTPAMRERTPVRELVDHAALAERAGFDYAIISDHFSPWLAETGHSPCAWSVLGAAAQATRRLPLVTYVTCPLMRYHPAVVAQKAATMGVLSKGRFTLGLGAGENLDEHVIGEGWPPVDTRHRMLREAVQIIRELFDGDYVTFQGEFYDIDSAKLHDLPDQRVPIGIAASGGRSAEIAAEFGDILMINDPMPEVVERFQTAGGAGRPVYGQLAIAYDADAEAVVEAAQKYTDAGYTHLALVRIGADQQQPFFAWAESELLPALRRL